MGTEVDSGANAATKAQGTRWRLARSFLANRQGVTAIEFGMLALPFSMLLFAILEGCISFAGQQLLANAADNVARQIRTGQLLPQNVNKDTMRTLICNDLSLLVGSGCPGLEIDLKEYATFADAAKVRIKYTAQGDLDTAGFDVKAGPAMSKNMLRVFYRWPIMTDLMRKSMSGLPDGKTLLFASATWKNEPF